MKASSPRKFARAASTLFILSALALPAISADVLVLKNGQRREGEVVGVSGTNVAIKVGPAQSTIPLAEIASAEIAAPAAFDNASKFMAEGNAARALVEIRPVVEKYRGLPVAWVPQAFAIQGDALVQLNQLDEAEKVFAAFAATYPESTALAAVATARLDVAKGNFDSAREKLAPVVDEASGILLAEPAKSANYGRAFLLMGQVREASGDYSAALQDYLRTVTVFYADASAVAEAQRRADALVAEKNVIAP
jgi:tetratricopeptide (TPR) repeat protein